jgi:ABC-type methionine transport system ATPase subunit
MKVKRRLMFTYTAELIREPVIYNLGEQFNIITNIHEANIAEDRGWIILDMEGEAEDIEEGIAWATSRGMRVEPAGEDIEVDDSTTE